MRLALVLLVGALWCAPSPAPAPAPAPTEDASLPARPALPWKAAAIAHGGVGNAPENSDACRAAVDAALRALARGADPVDAAVEGVVVMEDDPRFNAGTGASVRLDGKSIQMDASVMRSDGRFGAVAGVENVKNPVKVARAVLDTPHLLLQGDGATRFARTLGFPPYDPTTPERVAKARAAQQKLVTGDPSLPPAWRRFDWRTHWNYEMPLAEAIPGAGSAPTREPVDRGAHDTVGVAVRTTDGTFAVALSTGGTGGLVMRGRVGDVPILGAGLYAGPAGAAAATGAGERVMEEGLAREVHGWLAEGKSPKEAADRAVARIKDRGDIGIVVIGPRAMAASADRPMAWAAREEGSPTWDGPIR
jgi:isoaspartyl peptidase/L-asparaginase-like protein (Ntn-hydrolase superfamily)